MDIRRIIKEELLKEVGGYDDPNIMGIHVSSTLLALADSYNELTNLLQGLANATMDGESKNSLVGYLKETSESINFLVKVIDRAIKDFTEDELILKARNIIKSLKSFKRRVDVLSNFSHSMGNEGEFIDRVKKLLMDLIPSVNEYGKQLDLTNKMFKDRFSNMGHSSFGFGFNKN